jgi:hypothetical protein
MKVNFDIAEFQRVIQTAMDEPRLSKGEHRFPAHKIKTHDWIVAEARLNSVSVNRAIQRFVATGEWPELSGETGFYLLLRLQLARQAIDDLSRHADGHPFKSAPKTNCTEDVLNWLLVDLWNEFGTAYLFCFTQDVLKKLPPVEETQS